MASASSSEGGSRKGSRGLSSSGSVRRSWSRSRPWRRISFRRPSVAATKGVGQALERGVVEPPVAGDVGGARAAFLIIGACVLPVRTGPVANALQWHPLALVGVASYSLAVALASYAVIESPFLRLRRQWARSAAKQEAPPHPDRVPA